MTEETTPAETTKQPETLEEQGSEPLPLIKHETFAQAISRGVAPSDAYELAGFSRNAGNAQRLRNQEHVRNRVDFLQSQLAKAMTWDAKWIKERIGLVADALTEIIVDPLTGKRSPGPMFNAAQGNRALELLGREAGIFKDKIELGGHVAVGNTDMLRKMKPEERSLMKEMLLGVLGRPPEPANDDTAPEEAAPTGVVPAAK